MNDMTNKILLVILTILIILGIGFTWLIVNEDASQPTGPSCSEEVSEVEVKTEGSFCTQEVATLRCASDLDYLYEARNGCIIGELRARGWEKINDGVQD